MKKNAIRRLCLADLHWGMLSTPQLEAKLFEGLSKLDRESVPSHLIMFTGDLVEKGDKKESFDMGYLHRSTFGSEIPLLLRWHSKRQRLANWRDFRCWRFGAFYRGQLNSLIAVTGRNCE
jgi:hypothetical protein